MDIASSQQTVAEKSKHASHRNCVAVDTGTKISRKCCSPEFGVRFRDGDSRPTFYKTMWQWSRPWYPHVQNQIGSRPLAGGTYSIYSSKEQRRLSMQENSVDRRKISHRKANQNLTWNSYSWLFKVMHLAITEKLTRGCISCILTLALPLKFSKK